MQKKGRSRRNPLAGIRRSPLPVLIFAPESSYPDVICVDRVRGGTPPICMDIKTKGAVLVVLGTDKTWNSVCLEEKREQAPALPTQLPTE